MSEAISKTQQKALAKDVQATKQAISCIGEQVRTYIQTAGHSEFIAAGYLLTAKDLHNDAISFIAWAEKEFNFKKAYIYRLIQVFEAYKEVPELQGQSITALYALIKASDEQKLVFVEMAESGLFFTANNVKDLLPELFKKKKITKAPALPTNLEIEDTVVESTVVENAVKEDLTDSFELERKQYMLEIERLQNRVTELEVQNSDLKDSQAPQSLPQFKSPDAFIVLGCTAKRTQQVHLAYKAFSKIWTKANSPVVSKALIIARDAALQEIKKDKRTKEDTKTASRNLKLMHG